jgi:hypothetical protein
LASVRAVGATTFARLRPPPDEIIRLDTGTLEISVAPSNDGRRLRVETDDASIDVSAGRFRAEARAHTLVALRVFAGFAYVTTKGERAALYAGDEWARAADDGRVYAVAPVGPAASNASVPSQRPRADGTPSMPLPVRSVRAHALKSSGIAMLEPPPSATSNRSAAMAVTPRASFERGWNLLRSGDPAGAAVAFAEVEAFARGDAIAEDALFWQAVSLAKASRKPEARAAMTRFMARFPESARFGEASALLGWMLLEAGDRDGARQAFERAAHDRVERVRASAAGGLQQLEAVSPPASR